jgi:hypothetical protein
MTENEEARAANAGPYGSAGIWSRNRTPNSPPPTNPQASLCMARAADKRRSEGVALARSAGAA